MNDTIINLTELQAKHKEWASKRYGLTKKRISLESAAGVCEEAGELIHAVLKEFQRDGGRIDHRYDNVDFESLIRDAAGDIVMFLLDLANLRGFDLGAIILRVAEHVMNRDEEPIETVKQIKCGGFIRSYGGGYICDICDFNHFHDLCTEETCPFWGIDDGYAHEPVRRIV